MGDRSYAVTAPARRSETALPLRPVARLQRYTVRTPTSAGRVARPTAVD